MQTAVNAGTGEGVAAEGSEGCCDGNEVDWVRSTRISSQSCGSEKVNGNMCQINKLLE
jgi:hypothetical protein